jgi:uncharacterized protein YgbK (DUF1537 family)
MIKEKVLLKETAFSGLPPEYSGDLLSLIRTEIEKDRHLIVVLDDDPTGTQTVHNIPVLTRWDLEYLVPEMENPGHLFYILTNTRSMNAGDTFALIMEISENLKLAAEQTGRKLMVISRSDSTLRGHYPLETDALTNGLGYDDAIQILIPAFFEGGRFTLNDIHYVQEEDQLVPAALTPFAADATFGYQFSNLKQYVEEKTLGKVKSGEVISFPLEKLRLNGPKYVTDTLTQAPAGSTCIVNAVGYQDLRVFAAGLLRLDRPVILRTAASFVPALSGLEPKPLLPQDDFRKAPGKSVLIVVGSHVPKTTAQFNYLVRNCPELKKIELQVQKVIDTEPDKIAEIYAGEINRLLAEGDQILLYTSRELIRLEDKFESLALSKKISETITSVIRKLKVQPRTIIAKGGITSSDIATEGLQVKRAMVKGQVLPGIPVWELGSESKFPGMNYVVFPGNVGGEDAVCTVYRICSGQ